MFYVVTTPRQIEYFAIESDSSLRVLYDLKLKKWEISMISGAASLPSIALHCPAERFFSAYEQALFYIETAKNNLKTKYNGSATKTN